MATNKTEARPSSLTFDRRTTLWVILLLTPFLVLGLVEIILRVANYGGNLDLAATRAVSGREYYVINRRIGLRYFWGSGITVPEPSEDVFEKIKGKNTKRIFCLGESTMAGFPYEFNATAPSLLRTHLQALLPQHNIEVVNLGLSAISSHVIKDLLNEVLQHEPDLLILYSGHNEFYGAYGAGSALRVPGGRWLTGLTIWLTHFRTFLLLRDAVAWVSTSPDSGIPPSMMEQLAHEQSIPMRSMTYVEARETYRVNLLDMIHVAKDHDVPLLVSGLVSNLRDQPPFVSLVDTSIGPAKQREFAASVAAAESLMNVGKAKDATRLLAKAIAIDSNNAAAHYRLGRSYLETGSLGEARHAFIRAKDLDALRFRASEDFVAELRNLCKTLKVPVADVDSAFAAASPNSVIGHELIIEHLHPNVDGYALMARCWTETIARHHLLVDSTEWHWEADKNDKELLDLSGVTSFDRAVGRLRIAFLTSRWPFRQNQSQNEIKPTDPIEAIALRYIRKEIGWQEARYELAAHFVKKGNYESARKEAFAVARVIPYSYEPRLRIADYYLMEGRKEEAGKAYIECMVVEDNPYARSKLALILLEGRDFKNAAGHLERAFTLASPSQFPLPRAAEISNRFFLGYAYSQMGQKEKAREQLRIVLEKDPGHSRALDLLRQL